MLEGTMVDGECSRKPNGHLSPFVPLNWTDGFCWRIVTSSVLSRGLYALLWLPSVTF